MYFKDFKLYQPSAAVKFVNRLAMPGPFASFNREGATSRQSSVQVAEVIQDVFELLDPLAEDVLEPYASLKNTYNLRKS